MPASALPAVVWRDPMTRMALPQNRPDAADLYRRVLGEGGRPDAWQLALTTDVWPRVLIAPTGSGKTAAVTLGWAAHRLRSPDRTPRRLVWCLPMRSLVEQTAEAAREWFEKLKDIEGAEGRLPQPEDVFVLMGGVKANDWLERPEHPAVLVGTQDMLLSRALMRGYASSRALWPMEFALLHQDAQWVFDEVQLMGAGRATSTQLEAFRQSEADRARNGEDATCTLARSLWISATLDPGWLSTVDHPAPSEAAVLRVDPAAASDDRLSRLTHAVKTLARSPVAPASAKKGDIGRYVSQLADAILDAHRDGRMTLAILNRVDRAQALRDALENRLSRRRQSVPTLALVHSRFRPADRAREMDKVTSPVNEHPHGRIVVATQAVEAGVDISAAVLFTELAPWSSLVQRFGRANRYAEVTDGARVYWIDLLQTAGDTPLSDKAAEQLATPYVAPELEAASERLAKLNDVAPVHLPVPGDVEAPRQVIRRKDLEELFDTDPDLTGHDVDVSPYVRDADDTDVHVFWREPHQTGEKRPRPSRDEICRVSIGAARTWVGKLPKKGRGRLFQRDPQWRRGSGSTGAAPPGWQPLQGQPWPGLLLLADTRAGGYLGSAGFTGDPKNMPDPIPAAGCLLDDRAPSESEGHDEDTLSESGTIVTLADHLRHVAAEADSLCTSLGVGSSTRSTVIRAARWHDLGKAHEVFQDTMRRGLDGKVASPDVLLAKTAGAARHGRAYFRHELASALAFLAHEDWSRRADLVAYLIAAHHGKVRLNLRALPREVPPKDDRSGSRFVRGVWEGDELPAFDLEGEERWGGGALRLSIMELGWDDVSRESWTERTRELLAGLGPFRLAWLETLLRVADWRASAAERNGGSDEG